MGIVTVYIGKPGWPKFPFVQALPGPYMMIVEFIFGFMLIFAGILAWKMAYPGKKAEEE